MNGVTVIRINGFELQISPKKVTYAVKGRYHHCTFEQFTALLARHFKPSRQQKVESP